MTGEESKLASVQFCLLKLLCISKPLSDPGIRSQNSESKTRDDGMDSQVQEKHHSHVLSAMRQKGFKAAH